MRARWPKRAVVEVRRWDDDVIRCDLLRADSVRGEEGAKIPYKLSDVRERAGAQYVLQLPDCNVLVRRVTLVEHERRCVVGVLRQFRLDGVVLKDGRADQELIEHEGDERVAETVIRVVRNLGMHCDTLRKRTCKCGGGLVSVHGNRSLVDVRLLWMSSDPNA